MLVEDSEEPGGRRRCKWTSPLKEAPHPQRRHGGR